MLLWPLLLVNILPEEKLVNVGFNFLCNLSRCAKLSLLSSPYFFLSVLCINGMFDSFQMCHVSVCELRNPVQKVLYKFSAAFVLNCYI